MSDQYGNYITGLVSLGEITPPGSGSGGTGSGGLNGVGSPEGVQTASPGTTYLDTSNFNFWAKATGTGNTGWIELIGN